MPEQGGRFMNCPYGVVFVTVGDCGRMWASAPTDTSNVGDGNPVPYVLWGEEGLFLPGVLPHDHLYQPVQTGTAAGTGKTVPDSL